MSTTTNVTGPSLVLADYAAHGGRPIPELAAHPTLSDVIARDLAIVRMTLAHAGDVPGGRALVIPADPSAQARPVRNLGWLLRHAGDIRHPRVGLAFTVSTWRYAPRPGVLPLPVEHHGPILLAHLEDGRTYACQFADPSVLHGFLNRPSFRGYLVEWDGVASSTTCAIGGAEYRTDIPAAIAQRRANQAREAYYRRNPSAPWGSHNPDHPDHVRNLATAARS